MNRRPFLLFLSSLVFLYFPLELGYRAVHTHKFSWVDCFFFGIVPIFLIVRLLRVTKLGWYTLVAMVALWGIHDLHLFYATRGGDWRFFSHLAIYILSLSYFINPRVRHLYFDPKMRWWRTKPRFETHHPTITLRDKIWDYPVMRNISEGGCFLETQRECSISDKIFLNIPLPVPLSVSVIKAEGEVRWISKSESKPGIGVQFKNLSPQDLLAVQQFVKIGL